MSGVDVDVVEVLDDVVVVFVVVVVVLVVVDLIWSTLDTLNTGTVTVFKSLS